jgi:hypothetical protein
MARSKAKTYSACIDQLIEYWAEAIKLAGGVEMKMRLMGFCVFILFCGFMTQAEAVPIEWGDDRIASLESYLEDNLTFFDTQNFKAYLSDTSGSNGVSSVDLHFNGVLWLTAALPFEASQIAEMVDPYTISSPLQGVPAAIDEANNMPAAAPVPEPATLLLVGSGMIGLIQIGKKRIKK